jgi:thiol-disulfide isomerase/thioredoxin
MGAPFPRLLRLVLAAAALIACLGGCRSPAPASAPPPPPPITAGPGTFKAVLINGGGKKQLNFQSHLTHIRTLVEFLRTSGADPADVVIFASDGSNPEADLATRARPDDSGDAWLLPPRVAPLLRPIQFVDSAVDGYPLRPASGKALRAWFATEGKSLRAGDTLLLYVTDHGEPNKTDPTNTSIVLWNEKLSVHDLRQLLAELDPGVRVVMLMSQCFGGSFANAIFTSGAGLTTSGRQCGFFASSADRPAYGCYPENLGRDGVGHSHHFFEALAAVGRMPEAQSRVLVTDDTPDVPNTTSDFYLQQLLDADAQRQGKTPTEVADAYINAAFRNRARWEPEIRLLDRVGSTFGMFSPRSLGELELQTRVLPQVSEQLRTYADRWQEALASLKEQNFDRFLKANPAWKERLNAKALAQLDPEARQRLGDELASALGAFTATDPATSDRLALLRERSDEAAQAAYRMEVRLGVVLRMRAILSQIAGRVYLAEHGTPAERDTYAALLACEDVNFLAEPAVASAAALEPPESFPPLDDDRRVVQAVMPAWMGIQFKPLTATQRTREERTAGAVTVMTVYPESAAAKAGLEVGDVILGPPGAPFQEPHQVREWTMRREIGEPAPLEIARNGHLQQIVLKPEPYPMKMPELPGPPKVGSAAPPLAKVTAHRGDQTLGAGKPRLLFFWATWCLPCKFSVPEVMAFAKARGVEVIAITDEEPEKLDQFFKEHGEPFPATVAVDPYRAAFQAYGVSGTPTFVLIDAAGAVQAYKSGYSAATGLGIPGWTFGAANVEKPK